MGNQPSFVTATAAGNLGNPQTTQTISHNFVYDSASDNWDPLPGSSSGALCDTELPAAAALADNESDVPSVPRVGAIIMGMDAAGASNIDRARLATLFDADSGAGTQLVPAVMLISSASGGGVEITKAEDSAHVSGDPGIPILCVANEANANLSGTDVDYTPLGTDREGSPRIIGNRAHDAVDSGNPIKIGGRAATANRTSVVDADRADMMTDKQGRVVTTPFHVRELTVQQFTPIALSGAETTILAAGAAGVFHDLTCLIISSNTTAVQITIRDTTGGAAVMVIDVPANPNPTVIPFTNPFKQTTAATNWTAQAGVGTANLNITVQAVKNV